MSTQAEAMDAVVTLALLWRYDHSEPETPARAQQREDGRILLQLLRDNDVTWSSDYPMKEIPAPGRAIAGLDATPVGNWKPPGGEPRSFLGEYDA